MKCSKAYELFTKSSSLNLAERQIDGLIVVLLISTVVCLLSLVPSTYFPIDTSSYTVNRDGPVIVRLTGDVEKGGIYYLPENRTVSDLLKMAGIESVDHLDQQHLTMALEAGQVVSLNHHELKVSPMDAAERLALELPIDLNVANADDLMLIPGIGERTAERIIAFREKSGPFRKVTDLKRIPGIKEKKLSQWDRYFYVTPSRRK